MLGSTFNNSLGPAATVRALETFVILGANKSKQWADQVRSQPGFAFSFPYHFIDAHGDPLSVSICMQCTYQLEYQMTPLLPALSILCVTAALPAVSVRRTSFCRWA
jgi:hypothetical protein